MLPLKLAVAARSFGLPLREMLNTARRLGVKGIQWEAGTELRSDTLSETGRRQFLHEMSELDLSVAALHLPTRRPMYELDGLEHRIAACHNAMKFAWQLKSRCLTLRIGRIPEDLEQPEGRLLRDVLGDLAQHSNHVGVTLAITPTRDSAASMKRLFDSIVSGPIGVNFDPAAFLLAGEKPEAAFRTLHDRILAFSVRDGRRDIDGGGFETAVGQGETRWDELLALSEEAGFRGWMTIDRTQGDDKPGDIARAAQFLTRMALGEKP